MKESYRRSNDPRPLEVEPSTAGATAPGDLETEISRLFIEWAVQQRLFTQFADDYRVPPALATAFRAGYEAGWQEGGNG